VVSFLFSFPTVALAIASASKSRPLLYYNSR
jgi:hypothetical protein